MKLIIPPFAAKSLDSPTVRVSEPLRSATIDIDRLPESALTNTMWQPFRFCPSLNLRRATGRFPTVRLGRACSVSYPNGSCTIKQLWRNGSLTGYSALSSLCARAEAGVIRNIDITMAQTKEYRTAVPACLLRPILITREGSCFADAPPGRTLNASGTRNNWP